MDLALQIFSNDKTVRNNTMVDLKEINNQSLATQARKGEQLVSMMPAFKNVSNLMGVDIVELPTKNDVLKNKKCSYDQQWLEESEAKLLKQIDDERRAILIMPRVKKHMEKL